ncbi:hypothetical protein PYCCODRAFT_996145 [Trametes coccinea BRFM310]|uniref:Uncharacterized protein n=1 Tax=Trametes coccinea (strain BRFM310) TaxID=1353009 RepID=A0A1Y2ID49_TRAC3|nr:hypothetical protein PYCCODRAFT_996145 [Trametes coccinea BRFM310]
MQKSGLQQIASSRVLTRLSSSLDPTCSARVESPVCYRGGGQKGLRAALLASIEPPDLWGVFQFCSVNIEPPLVLRSRGLLSWCSPTLIDVRSTLSQHVVNMRPDRDELPLLLRPDSEVSVLRVYIRGEMVRRSAMDSDCRRYPRTTYFLL